MTSTHETNAQGVPEKQDLSVSVGTPKGTISLTVSKTATVADVIQTVIDKLGLGGSTDSFELFSDVGGEKKELTPATRPLVSFGIKDGDKLLLAATGSGV